MVPQPLASIRPPTSYKFNIIGPWKSVSPDVDDLKTLYQAQRISIEGQTVTRHCSFCCLNCEVRCIILCEVMTTSFARDSKRIEDRPLNWTLVHIDASTDMNM